jgi:hypothetical protein
VGPATNALDEQKKVLLLGEASLVRFARETDTTAVAQAGLGGAFGAGAPLLDKSIGQWTLAKDTLLDMKESILETVPTLGGLSAGFGNLGSVFDPVLDLMGDAGKSLQKSAKGFLPASFLGGAGKGGKNGAKGFSLASLFGGAGDAVAKAGKDVPGVFKLGERAIKTFTQRGGRRIENLFG